MIKRKTILFCFLLAASSVAYTEPMKFQLDDDPILRGVDLTLQGELSVYAAGEITPGTTERFKTFVRNHKIDSVRVFFDSPGGSLVEGMELGETIRALSFSTAVGSQKAHSPHMAICASACAYSFAGGVFRYLSKDTGRLGVHQFYGQSNTSISAENAQRLSGEIVAYLDKMGVNATAFSLSTLADKDGIIWLTPTLAIDLHFANNGALPTTSELKMLSMVPYLKLEQVTSRSTARVLMLCADKTIFLRYGIVTDQRSATDMSDPSWLKRSYLEFDSETKFPVNGVTGIKTSDATIWIDRQLTVSDVQGMLRAKEIDGWLDGFGALRWGAQMDLSNIRPSIINYAKQCYGI